MGSISFSQDVIKGTYSYTYGDLESLVEARQTCKDLAIREAIESYHIFVESSTTVENFQLKEDIIHSISTASLRNVRIVEQLEEGRTITITIEGTVDQDEVKENISKMVTSHQTDESVQPSKEIEEMAGEDVSPFFSALAVYEKRMSSAEKAWGKKEFEEAQKQIQGMKSLLERYKPSQDRPYHWATYQVVWTRTILLSDLIRQDQLEAGGRRVRIRANLAVIQKRAKTLQTSIDQLEKLTSLTKPQQVFRNITVTRCQVVLNRANRKVTPRRRR